MRPEHICIRRDGEQVFLNQAAWPATTEVADSLLHQADQQLLELRYPFLIIRVANGHGVYRVETCDLGTWTATLVEGAVTREGED